MPGAGALERLHVTLRRGQSLVGDHVHRDLCPQCSKTREAEYLSIGFSLLLTDSLRIAFDHRSGTFPTAGPRRHMGDKGPARVRVRPEGVLG